MGCLGRVRALREVGKITFQASNAQQLSIRCYQVQATPLINLNVKVLWHPCRGAVFLNDSGATEFVTRQEVLSPHTFDLDQLS